MLVFVHVKSLCVCNTFLMVHFLISMIFIAFECTQNAQGEFSDLLSGEDLNFQSPEVSWLELRQVRVDWDISRALVMLRSASKLNEIIIDNIFHEAAWHHIWPAWAYLTVHDLFNESLECLGKTVVSKSYEDGFELLLAIDRLSWWSVWIVHDFEKTLCFQDPRPVFHDGRMWSSPDISMNGG